MPRSADGAPSRIYLPELAATRGSFELAASEAHYVARVVRAQPGETLEATDGRGCLARLRIRSVRPAVEVEIETRTTVERSAPGRVLCGAPEGQRADWLVEKLAELGVAEFQPIDCQRARWEGARPDRWERLAVAALRQSRGAWKLEILEPRPLAAVMAAPAGADCWLADPDGPVPDAPGPAAGSRTGAVGPAEGFTEAEREALISAGFRPVRLAGTRLRTETAALALAAWWACAPGS